MRRRAFIPALKPDFAPPLQSEQACAMPPAPTRYMPPELDAIIDELLMIDAPGRLNEVLSASEDNGAVDRLRARAGAKRAGSSR